MNMDAQRRRNDLGNLLNFAVNPAYRGWPVPPDRSGQDSPVHSLDSVVLVEEEGIGTEAIVHESDVTMQDN